MRARKINCSSKCPLDGTRRATLRGLLEDYRQEGFVCQEEQYCTERVERADEEPEEVAGSCDVIGSVISDCKHRLM
jgi:hypothetical protein